MTATDTDTDTAAEPRVIRTPLTGRRLLNEPELNKGTAFTLEERAQLGLHGLLPPRVETLDEQVAATLDRYQSFEDDLQRHVFLRALEDTNEVLFYAFLDRHLTDLLPIVYTPTVGLACQQFSHIYRRPHGLFLSYPNRHLLDQQLASIAGDIDVIVMTDGERILGLGDQGLGGMGIPIGKLALYTAAGGIDPRRSLPVLLDVGTNNQSLLDDEMYLGWRNERVTGDAYDEFVDDVVRAIRRRFPSVLLQWEDFSGHHAHTLLARYRRRILSFNDDIQGTAAVVLAAVLAAVERSGMPLVEHRICIAGAGAAGCGIAGMLADGFQRAGEDAIGGKLFLTDVDGLVHSGRDDLTPSQRPFATPGDLYGSGVDTRLDTLDAVVEHVEPTILIGVSGQGGLFAEAVVRRMADRTAQPIILPLSNPTSRAEAHPADLLRWTGGRAIVATGSPFEGVTFGGRSVEVAQANNVYIFPGLGLGALVAEAGYVSDGMLLAAAEALADEAARCGGDHLLPPLGHIKQTSRRIATAVARTAIEEQHALTTDDRDIESLVERHFYEPEYAPIQQ